MMRSQQTRASSAWTGTCANVQCSRPSSNHRSSAAASATPAAAASTRGGAPMKGDDGGGDGGIIAGGIGWLSDGSRSACERARRARRRRRRAIITMSRKLNGSCRYLCTPPREP